jgi:hypothetical protein
MDIGDDLDVVKIIQEPYSDFSTAYYSSEVLEYR